jgi:hypothetical protein
MTLNSTNKVTFFWRCLKIIGFIFLNTELHRVDTEFHGFSKITPHPSFLPPPNPPGGALGAFAIKFHIASANKRTFPETSPLTPHPSSLIPSTPNPPRGGFPPPNPPGGALGAFAFKFHIASANKRTFPETSPLTPHPSSLIPSTPKPPRGGFSPPNPLKGALGAFT